MSEQTQSTNQMVVIGLAVVAVLLAAIAGILVWQQSNAAELPTPVASEGNSMGDVAGATEGAPAGMGGAAAAAPVEFDEKTATKVPAGTTPLEFVKAYHEAVKAGDFEAAYKMLPLDKQTSYVDAKSYAEQVKAYGITGYELGEPTEEGDTFSISATQVTPQMPISYTWTLKKVGDTWYCASRTMGGQ
jgi:hypothetical protein